MPRESNAKRKTPALRGLGQLTLVEHSLCPLDPRASLRPHLTHRCRYRYVDPTEGPSTAQVVVSSPRGLAARDEFYLWGLLGITFAQQDPSADLYVTPHYCLRQLGIIEGESKGGESYRLFREALRRLAAVHYENDRFYDPVRREHREVGFGFLSYSLPANPESNRAWRIVWDPLFFEICRASGSGLGFDLVSYRELDPASRRLLLILQKVFWRRRESPRFDLRHLGTNVLGYSESLDARTLRMKLKRSARTLADAGFILPDGAGGHAWFSTSRQDRIIVQFQRGPSLDRAKTFGRTISTANSPLHDPLIAIGFENQQVQRILSRYPARQIQLWSDVTLAALEHKGERFFRRSPQAFFMDNIKNASKGERTCPDWFLALRKEEELNSGPRRRTSSRTEAKNPGVVGGFRRAIEGTDAEQVVRDMLGSFHKSANKAKTPSR